MPRRQRRGRLNYLRVVRRWPAWRNNSGGQKIGRHFVRWGEPGAADVLGVLPGGRLLCVEAKVGRNRPTPAQEAWLSMVRAAGALALVTRSVQELEEQFREAGY